MKHVVSTDFAQLSRGDQNLFIEHVTIYPDSEAGTVDLDGEAETVDLETLTD